MVVSVCQPNRLNPVTAKAVPAVRHSTASGDAADQQPPPAGAADLRLLVVLRSRHDLREQRVAVDRVGDVRPGPLETIHAAAHVDSIPTV